MTVASAADGRLRRRLEATRGRPVTRMALTADRGSLLVASRGEIWSVPVEGGAARAETRGTSMAVDPRGRFMLVQREADSGVQVVRRDLSGRETLLALPPEYHLVRSSLWPAAIGADGRVALVVGRKDGWFWRPVVLDLESGRVEGIPLRFAGDLEQDVAWDGDRIVALGRRMEAAIWRFTPAGSAR